MVKEASYEQLLERGRKAFPESVKVSERFQPPKVVGHIQGNRTILSNFLQIASTLGRDPEQFLKYILKELATPGDIKRGAVIIGRKVSASSVNEKVKKYVDVFVLCPECGKPDTKLLKERDIPYMKCLACGAKHVVKGRI